MKLNTGEIAKLKNLGPASAEMLAKIDIYTKTDLEETGSIPAYLRLKGMGFPVSPNLVYAIEGALTGTHRAELPKYVKERLRKECGE